MRFVTPMIVMRYLKLIKSREEAISLNINLLAERHELFIIISIGEIIAASLASEGASVHPDTDTDDSHHRFLEDSHADDPLSPFQLVPLVVLIAALVKISYFDVAEHPAPTGSSCRPRKHAMSASPYRGLTWVLLHLPLNCFIVLLGAVLEPLKLHGSFPK